MSVETKFLTVVDTFPGYCQVCHIPQLVGKVAVAGWEYQGAICSVCLSAMADEVQRRGKGLITEKIPRNGHGEMLVGIRGRNGDIACEFAYRKDILSP